MYLFLIFYSDIEVKYLPFWLLFPAVIHKIYLHFVIKSVILFTNSLKIIFFLFTQIA